MRISIILPTRKRFQALKLSAESLLNTLDSAEIEFMLALDDDDQETIALLQENPIPFSRVTVGRRAGYKNLHVYVNELSARSTGDWLFLWNDDAIMQTPGWDHLVAQYQGQLVIVNPETNHGNHALSNCIFPIVPKEMVDILGHFSLSNHNDTYVEKIANALGIRRDVPILVCHDRADLTGANHDDVYREREFSTSEFFGPSNLALIEKDILMLREHLAKRSSTTG